MKSGLVSLALLLFVTLLSAQKDDFTVESIFSSSDYSVKTLSGVRWIPGHEAFTYLKKNESGERELWRCDAASGACSLFIKHDDLKIIESAKQAKRFTLPSYIWAPDGVHILVPAENDLFLFDSGTKELVRLTHDAARERDPRFSPDSKKIAYIKNDNLTVLNIASKEEKALTTEGNKDIFIGRFDWVYEEEFSIRTGFQWSPDSKHIAYFRLDQSGEPCFPIVDFVPLENTVEYTKYPKAGDPNAFVKIGIVDVITGGTTWIDRTAGPDDYFSRIKWTPDSKQLSITYLNRDQNHLELLFADQGTGKTRIVLQETVQNGWVEGAQSPRFIGNEKGFLWLSERDGFNHIYYYDMIGRLKKQVTHGEWDVRNILRVAQKQKKVYFSASKLRREENHLYVVSFHGRGMKQLSKESGTHSINCSPSGEYYIDIFSNFSTPTRQALYNRRGKLVKMLRDDQVKALPRHPLANIEFLSFRTSNGDVLPAYMIKPVAFDRGEKHPVLIYTYGGPGSQIVTNRWFGSRGFWYTFLTQKGYLVFAVDGRGTANRGRAWKEKLYLHLGILEIQDQIEGAKYLGTLPFVDAKRIGIWGWSYGGYTTVMCMLKGADYFKTGVAVAPVTDWRNYDSIYTERFMAQPDDNEDNYNEASAANFADKLRGKLLILHGSSDDNVHFSNTMQLAQALEKHRKLFDLMVYPRKRHGIHGTDERVHLYKKITGYILENL
ncbi:MAG: prolyl oligopeptidase family serine peptidase [Actinobacteria bacterium]|nr:prolyl oligopeptidase family serine peptidase [Actinomycetota bacterium]